MEMTQDGDGDGDDDDFWGEDDSECKESNEDLRRESDRRQKQFHTIGYRDGLTSGQEASAQEGFNSGFKKSVLVGYQWGLVRGVTSALACLADGLQEKLVGIIDTREKLQKLHESVHSVSSQDALKLFHLETQTLATESDLGRCIREFGSLDLSSSSIKLHPTIEQQTAG